MSKTKIHLIVSHNNITHLKSVNSVAEMDETIKIIQKEYDGIFDPAKDMTVIVGELRCVIKKSNSTYHLSSTGCNCGGK